MDLYIYAASCLACLMLGYALGWRGGEARAEKKHDDLRELRMLVRDAINEKPVESAEIVETLS